MKLAHNSVWRFDTRDLMRVSTCSHCTNLSILRSLSVPSVLEVLQPYIAAQEQARIDGTDKTLPQRYGEVFETALEEELQELTEAGAVQKPEAGDGPDAHEALFASTLRLMEEGVPIIYQGALVHTTAVSQFRGKPDFLVREDWALQFVNDKLTASQVAPTPERPLYTAWDAKLSTKPKPIYALQVGLYISALEAAGFKAENGTHGIILGSRRLEQLQENEVAPATQLAVAALEAKIIEMAELTDGQVAALANGFEYACETKAACDICEYPDLCDHTRSSTNDIVMVHGIRQRQLQSLRAAGITTIAQLANTHDAGRPEGIDAKTWHKLQGQARVQELSRTSQAPQSELLPNPALRYLPTASEGDIFFDMEGFPYYQGGLEYLFGNYTRQQEFVEFWAHNRAEEKAAFEQFVDWAVARLDQYPEAHIYHYASYEMSALRRLANRHATREVEVDNLLRDQKLVDLAQVVKDSLIVGSSSYSIKYLEPHYGFKRSADVKKATDSVDGYDSWIQLRSIAANESLDDETRENASMDAQKLLADLREYNKEDVISTLELYQWLAKFQGAHSHWGSAKELVAEESAEETKSQLVLKQLLADTQNLLAPLDGLEYGINAQLDKQADAWAALAHSILFYKREDVMFWTNMHVRITKDAADLENDKEAAAIHNVSEISRGEPAGVGRQAKVTRQFTAGISADGAKNVGRSEQLIARYVNALGKAAWAFGKVIDISNHTVVFQADFPVASQDAIPDALFAYATFRTDSKIAALKQLAAEITSVWQHPHNTPPKGYPALDLLLRTPPRLAGFAPLQTADHADYLPSVIATAEALNSSVLAIQGPPGTGKTYLASRTIAHLVARGYRVGVVSQSHRAVENLLQACIDAGISGQRIMKSNSSKDKSEKAWMTPSGPVPLKNLAGRAGRAIVVGGTSFTFCNTNVSGLEFDYLFVDEAAQFSMVDALAVSLCTKNLVLLGDPQQLAQVVTAIHPGGVENSALGHYMGDHEILPDGMGYFVAVTRRLHPKINQVVSNLAYNGQLEAHPSTSSFKAPDTASGLHLVPVRHSHNSTHSPEEVEAVLGIVQRHLQTLSPDQILVISPYNAQVNALRERLNSAGLQEVEVGTVDKFQGREAMVVIYSFAASDTDSAPRGLEFLLDQHRLNVGISRAKAVCYLVYSPDLLRANFRSLPELKAVSRFAGVLSYAVV